MTVLYPNLCCNGVSYEGTTRYYRKHTSVKNFSFHVQPVVLEHIQAKTLTKKYESKTTK